MQSWRIDGRGEGGGGKLVFGVFAANVLSAVRLAVKHLFFVCNPQEPGNACRKGLYLLHGRLQRHRNSSTEKR